MTAKKGGQSRQPVISQSINASLSWEMFKFENRWRKPNFLEMLSRIIESLAMFHIEDKKCVNGFYRLKNRFTRKR